MSKKPLKVIAGTPDHPLVIGEIEIQCYVLEDETRVLSQQGFLEAIGRARKAKGGHGAGMVDNAPAFLASKNLEPFISIELSGSTTAVPFSTVEGRKGYGHRAELLPQVCSAYLAARDAGTRMELGLHLFLFMHICAFKTCDMIHQCVYFVHDKASRYHQGPKKGRLRQQRRDQT